MTDMTTTLVGNLTEDPKHVLLPSGIALTNLRVASTPRILDRSTGDYRDGDTVYLTVTCWRQLAEHAANSLRKGDRILVIGRLRQRTYDVDGQRRTVTEVSADALGPDLWRSAVRVERHRRAYDGEPAQEVAGPGGLSIAPAGEHGGVMPAPVYAVPGGSGSPLA